MSDIPLLDVRSLSVEFRTRNGTVHALEDVSLAIAKGEAVALVGESGSGKSVTAYALLGILDPAGQVTSGTATFGGMDLLALPERELQEIRGREISMIFQNPRVALNPIRRVGDQIADVLIRHDALTRSTAPAKAVEMLRTVGIADPQRRARAYPFELSGGMCQRVMIAIALACRPSLVIADEPTTGLDVTTQAVIMDLVQELGRARGMSTLFITHDLGLASEYADRIVVMHAGHVVEAAPTTEIFRNPRHPYTAKLIAATPGRRSRLAELMSVPGNLPDLRRDDLPPCRYSARCERKRPECDAPLNRRIESGRMVACANPL